MLTSKSTKTLLLLALSATALTGCSSGGISQNEVKSPDPSSSPKESGNPEEFNVPKFDYTKKIELAKNDLELEFLTIAINSCKKAETDGFMLTESSGTSYFRPAETGIFPVWTFDEFRVSDGKPTSPRYTNYPPGIFSPCSLEYSARGRNLDDVGLEHKVKKISSNQYIWAEHAGGYSLEETKFEVQDGLIVKETYGEENLGYSVEYGPFTDAELEVFDLVTD
jgi:hypothetical protein